MKIQIQGGVDLDHREEGHQHQGIIEANQNQNHHDKCILILRQILAWNRDLILQSKWQVSGKYNEVLIRSHNCNTDFCVNNLTQFYNLSHYFKGSVVVHWSFHTEIRWELLKKYIN